jgi:hypothetical protein
VMPRRVECWPAPATVGACRALQWPYRCGGHTPLRAHGDAPGPRALHRHQRLTPHSITTELHARDPRRAAPVRRPGSSGVVTSVASCD